MSEPRAGADIPAWETRADIVAPAPAPAPPPVQPEGQYSPDGRWFWNGQEWVPAQAPFAASTAACMVCGATPAVQATLRSVAAFVAFGVTTTQRGVYCRDCGLAVFRKRMSLTLLTGWWGFIHFFINIGVIIGNLGARARIMALGAPSRDPRAQPLDPGRPVFFRAGFLVSGVVVIVVGALGIANALKPPPPPFPAADLGYVGQCARLTSSSWTAVDCAYAHDGKVVSLAYDQSGCPGSDQVGKLPDNNVACIDTTK